MKRLQLQGVRRGKVVRTTRHDPAIVCPHDKVNRQFKASLSISAQNFPPVSVQNFPV